MEENNDKNFVQVCVVHFSRPEEGITQEMLDDWRENLPTIDEKLGVRTKFIDIVESANKEFADVLFYIHNDDITKFAIPRLSMGIRWFEDVVLNRPYHYPKDIITKYYSWPKN